MKIEAFLIFITIPLVCKCGSKYKSINIQIREKLEHKINNFFGLNSFEIQSFEHQKKITQLLFEDLPMIVLDGFILFKILDLSEM